ncbi:MAG: radical SAM protein [Nitrospirae bacterium]|nr:radical SAM protein [Nitrospirota bacterium]
MLELPQQLASLELFHNGHWNVDPLIDTGYFKTSNFASAPRRIYWEFTRICNLNCKSCFNRFFANKGEMSMTSLLNLAKQLYDAGVYEIRCTGGEPTMRPDFFELVDELKKMGFYLSMGSNGIYSNSTLEKVMKASVDWIILSIDGSDESTHSEIRGEGTFAKVLQTLEHLAPKKRRLRINTLIRKTHHEYDHLKGLAILCDKFDVESLNCIPLRPMTNDPKVLDLQLTAFEFKKFVAALNQLKQEHRTDIITAIDLRHTSTHDRVFFKDCSCAAGREGAVISPYGETYGCSYSLAYIPDSSPHLRKKYVAGNVLEQDFLEIWNQSQRWSLYRDLEAFKNKTCKICDYYITKRCTGTCPIMNKDNPAAFDPYCYLHLTS